MCVHLAVFHVWIRSTIFWPTDWLDTGGESERLDKSVREMMGEGGGMECVKSKKKKIKISTTGIYRDVLVPVDRHQHRVAAQNTTSSRVELKTSEKIATSRTPWTVLIPWSPELKLFLRRIPGEWERKVGKTDSPIVMGSWNHETLSFLHEPFFIRLWGWKMPKI